MSDPERGCGIGILIVFGVGAGFYSAVAMIWGWPGIVTAFLVSVGATGLVGLYVHFTEGGS